MEEWAEIRRLHRAEGLSIKAIIRRLGISRNTVRKALASCVTPRIQRATQELGGQPQVIGHHLQRSEDPKVH